MECSVQQNRVRIRGGVQRARGAPRLVRSRSYPGFSVGILLSVKVILPVNSVFIPLLNEIHRSMEKERESEREMTKNEKKKDFHRPPFPRRCLSRTYNSK